MKIGKYIYVLLVCLLILPGCVKDNQDDCPPVTGPVGTSDDWFLHFKAIPDKYVFSTLVESLTLFVYNMDEHYLVGSRDYERPELSGDGFVVNVGAIDFVVGDEYRFVAVMNLADDYTINGQDYLLDYELEIIGEDTIQSKLSDVFYGYVDAIAMTKATVRRDTVDLLKIPNNVFVTIELEGFELPVHRDLVTHIYGSNTTYEYNKNCSSRKTVTYMPHNWERQTNALFTYDMTTGRIWTEDDLVLRIEEYDQETGFVRDVSMILTEQLASLTDELGNYLYDTDEKLDNEDDFYLHFVINERFEILELKINNWFAIKPGVDL